MKLFRDNSFLALLVQTPMVMWFTFGARIPRLKKQWYKTTNGILVKAAIKKVLAELFYYS